MTPEIQSQNKRWGLYLLLVLLGLIAYSLAVIGTRGDLPPPRDMTPLQKMQRR